MRTDPTFWIVARASGLTAYLLFTCGTLAGLLLKSRALGTRVKPVTVTDLHRFLALLGLVAVGVHGIALLYDTSVKIDLLGLVTPGRIPYRPVWTGAGVAASELAVLIYLSFSVRKIIKVRNWRRLHWLSYALFVAITAHGLLAGSDSNDTWARYLYLGAIGAVTTATAFRALAAKNRPRRIPATAPAPIVRG